MKFFNIVKWLAFILAGLILLIFICLFTYRAYLKNTTKIKTASGISSLEEIILGEIKQWIVLLQLK